MFSKVAQLTSSCFVYSLHSNQRDCHWHWNTEKQEKNRWNTLAKSKQCGTKSKKKKPNANSRVINWGLKPNNRQVHLWCEVRRVAVEQQRWPWNCIHILSNTNTEVRASSWFIFLFSKMLTWKISYVNRLFLFRCPDECMFVGSEHRVSHDSHYTHWMAGSGTVWVAEWAHVCVRGNKDWTSLNAWTLVSTVVPPHRTRM